MLTANYMNKISSLIVTILTGKESAYSKAKVPYGFSGMVPAAIFFFNKLDD